MPISGYSVERLDNESMSDLVIKQQKMLEKQQQQIDDLRKTVHGKQNKVSQRMNKPEDRDRQKTRSSSKVSISKKGLRIRSADGAFSFQTGGRIHADYAYYDDDVTPLGSGANLRRARVYFKGKFFNDWRYKAEIDFAEDGDVGPRSVWLGYTGWKPASIKLGYFQEAVSLEDITSSNAITFMERSLMNTFTPGYNLGIAANSSGDFWSLSGGVFGGDLGEKDDDIDDGMGVSGRATLAPILFDNKLLHLGFSSEYRKTGTENEWRIRTNPESRVTGRRFADTRTISQVDYSWLFAGEVAAAYGPFSIQAEYIHNSVIRNQAADLGFNGGYVQGSWFLTGESRPYDVKSGAFGLINPLHKYGALELATRYS